MKDYTEKIKKLLALAESNNEYEAKAALLKAKELMAAHKISEIDLVEIKDKKVRKVMSGVTYTNRSNRWVGTLACTIAENYCCGCAVSGSQTLEVMFIGLDGDVDVCTNIFKYAVDSANSCSQYYLDNVYKYRCNSRKVENTVKIPTQLDLLMVFATRLRSRKTGKKLDGDW